VLFAVIDDDDDCVELTAEDDVAAKLPGVIMDIISEERAVLASSARHMIL